MVADTVAQITMAPGNGTPSGIFTGSVLTTMSWAHGKSLFQRRFIVRHFQIMFIMLVV